MHFRAVFMDAEKKRLFQTSASKQVKFTETFKIFNGFFTKSSHQNKKALSSFYHKKYF